jgi:hypothetical protein
VTPRGTLPRWMWLAGAAALGSAAGFAGGRWLSESGVRPDVPGAMPELQRAAVPVEAPAAETLAGIATIDGVPSLALVVTGGRPALLRTGDPVDAAGAMVTAIEAQAAVITAAGGATRRLPLHGPALAQSSPAPQPASSARAMPALPPAGYGAVPMPPDDGRAGSGNAAFRAAVEERVRAMRKSTSSTP